ncbi:MAG: hypothetical protein ACI4T5_09650 [Prevotella sp.]
MSIKLKDKAAVTQMTDSDYIYGCFGGATGKMTIDNFRTHINDDDKQVLNDIAFCLDINSAHSTSNKVTVGGNLHMAETLFGMRQNILMNSNGEYIKLNRNDSRYTEDGEAVVNLSTNAVLAKWAHCDFMMLLPEYYGRVLVVTSGSNTKNLLYLSPVPLPKGFVIPQQVVGMYKSTLESSAMRSLPSYESDNTKTINAFWDLAQARSKNHGLANLDFRNYLLWYMMGTYGYRDSQGCKTADGTLVWGVGLDGTESTASGESVNDVGFTRQRNIKHGACMSLGIYDGKTAVTDSVSNTCHSVNVAGFENPWGQRWEMVQGLCSMTDSDDVYCWRHNWLPTGTPTAATFANVDCVKLTRQTTSSGNLMNVVTDSQNQGFYMIPKGYVSGISYGDYYGYGASGQLWRFGGPSSDGSGCGLASANSSLGWSYAASAFSARLAYYGDVKEVTKTALATLK